MDNGFVEQNPEAIYQNVLASVKQCLEEFEKTGHAREQIAAIGISNQRETFVVWDKAGIPLYNAVVWQCKRSVEICESLKQQGLGELINHKTGLLIDPYFSGTKLMWLAQHQETVKQALAKGEAYFGTIDTWLLYKLTGGQSYATDYTNASRTLLFNLHALNWDQELIGLFGLNGIQLPEIKPSSALYGKTTLEGLLDHAIPVTGMIGDSHAAAFGEGCFETGTAKATLGTGCSILMNIGDKPLPSKNGMVTTICWSTEATSCRCNDFGLTFSIRCHPNLITVEYLARSSLNLSTSLSSKSKKVETATLLNPIARAADVGSGLRRDKSAFS